MSPLESRSALDAEVLKQFRLIFQSVRKHFLDIESVCGISGAQLWALSRVAEQPGVRVTELALALAIHQSTASNLVEDLVQKGLIRRSRSETDQRAVLLHATDTGYELFNRAPKPLIGLLPDAIGRLDEEALQGLGTHLSQLIALMGRRIDTGGRATPLSEIANPQGTVRKARRKALSHGSVGAIDDSSGGSG